MNQRKAGTLLSYAYIIITNTISLFYTPYMYLNSRPTVAYGLNAIYSRYQASMPIVFAAMTFTTAVSLIIYCIFSKTIMESMSAGGLKG